MLEWESRATASFPLRLIYRKELKTFLEGRSSLFPHLSSLSLLVIVKDEEIRYK
jgi:hypothetical protein